MSYAKFHVSTGHIHEAYTMGFDDYTEACLYAQRLLRSAKSGKVATIYESVITYQGTVDVIRGTYTK